MSTHYEKEISMNRPVSSNTVGTKQASVITARLIIETSPVITSKDLYTTPWQMHPFWHRKAMLQVPMK
jgi:hypothetical protein